MTPTLAKLRPEIETLVRDNLVFLLDRCEAAADYGFADLKFNVLSGREFAADTGDVYDRRIVYGIIQGRAIEALARHATCFAGTSLGDRCHAVLRRVVDRVEALRKRLGGHLWFMMTPDGQRLRVSTNGRVTAAPAPPVATLTDLFHAKGLVTAAACLRDDRLLATAADYLRDVLVHVLAGTLVNDLEPMDPKNPVGDIPGRHSQAWMMLGLGGVIAALDARLAGDWPALGTRLWRTVAGLHVNRGQWPDLAPLDFTEFVDDGGRPWRDARGRVWCDPGHAIEFVGLSARMLITGKDCPATSFLPELFTHVFELGWNDAAGGICKSVDLTTRRPINSDLPWWSLPEAMRAAALLPRIAPDADPAPLTAALLACHRAYFYNYLRPGWGRLPIQTRAADGTPVDVIPAMPDADPLYHSGIAFLDILEHAEVSA